MHRTQSILARGDPGFFDFIKKIGGKALQVGQRAFGITPVGRAVAVGRQIFGPPAPPARRPIPQQRQFGPIAQGAIAIGSAAAVQGVNRIFDAQAAGGVQPAGTHLNKSSYFLRSGEFVPARSRYVRNRTRNNANGRALRRAIGRAKGFDNLVKRNRKALRSLARI